MHDFDSVRDVIFEENTAVGIALASFGSNVANYNFYDGYAHHVYHSANTMQHVWGADREPVCPVIARSAACCGVVCFRTAIQSSSNRGMVKTMSRSTE